MQRIHVGVARVVGRAALGTVTLLACSTGAENASRPDHSDPTTYGVGVLNPNPSLYFGHDPQADPNLDLRHTSDGANDAGGRLVADDGAIPDEHDASPPPRITDNDGVKNADETDVDCGGLNPRKCATDKSCLIAADCESKVCSESTKTCTAPTNGDNIQNGTETDVDCGGPEQATKRCVPGEKCVAHSDCTSDGCAFDNTCALRASCTQLAGGQTCGAVDQGSKQNDCCASAPVGPFNVDKYLITAGRMRAFLNRTGGKVRDWAATLPASKWNQTWTAQLPNSIDGTPGDGDNANTQLGPYYGKRSCETGYHTGHTFWTPLVYGDKKDFPQEVLDTKALNCVPWWLAMALCAFDGGHIVTAAELRAAYTNNQPTSTTEYPWGAIASYTTSQQNDRAVQWYSYATPSPPATARRDPSDNSYLDIAFYIAPPGRRPNGYSAMGHADLVGNLLEWVSNQERQFVWKGSFERHAQEADVRTPLDNDPWLELTAGFGVPQGEPWLWQNVVSGSSDAENVNGYYAIGARCAH